MKYKTMWDWLGISQTEDIAAIKKAFAEKSREYHPEEHPQEFLALQKAYHAAMGYAKAQKRAAEANEAAYRASAQQDAAYSQERRIRQDAGASGRQTEDARAARNGAVQNRQTENARAAQNSQTQSRRISESDRAERSQKEPREDTAKFNYEAVQHVLEKERWENLIADFVNIGYSTYLRNQLECWQFFFGQEKYQDLLCQTATWQEIIYQIKLINGWARQTILYLEACMHQHLAGRVMPKDYPVFPRWMKRRRFRLAEKINTSVKLQACAREQQLDAFIRDQIKRRDMGADKERYYASYLDVYLPYAVKNPQAVEWFHKMKSQKLHVYQVMFVIFLCCAGMIGLTLAGGMFYSDNPSKTTKQVEKKIKDIEREIEFQENEIPYQDEEYRQEMDRVMEDAIESYETWRQKMEEYDFEGTET